MSCLINKLEEETAGQINIKKNTTSLLCNNAKAADSRACESHPNIVRPVLAWIKAQVGLVWFKVLKAYQSKYMRLTGTFISLFFEAGGG